MQLCENIVRQISLSAAGLKGEELKSYPNIGLASTTGAAPPMDASSPVTSSGTHLLTQCSVTLGSSWFALWLMLLHPLCEPAWEVRPTPTSMVYVLVFFRCLLSCHLITERIPGLLTKILNLRLISQASLLDVYFLICVSCCNTIFFRISSLCYTKM